jgi:hypothetical protein
VPLGEDENQEADIIGNGERGQQADVFSQDERGAAYGFGDDRQDGLVLDLPKADKNKPVSRSVDSPRSRRSLSSSDRVKAARETLRTISNAAAMRMTP